MKPVYILIIAIILYSCSYPNMIKKELNRNIVPIGYLHDSKITNCPVIDTIFINIVKNSFDKKLIVSKVNSLTLPLIIFNYSRVNMNTRLGQNIISKNYDEFFTSSFTTETKRTGCFEVSSQPTINSKYKLDISIDSCVTDSKLKHVFSFLFLLIAYSYSDSYLGYPSETKLQVSAKLSKNGDIISEKKYYIIRNQPFFKPNANQFFFGINSNMAESLTFSTKKCIEDIINDINKTLKK